jgi:hypothetical protein
MVRRERPGPDRSGARTDKHCYSASEFHPTRLIPEHRLMPGTLHCEMMQGTGRIQAGSCSIKLASWQSEVTFARSDGCPG